MHFSKSSILIVSCCISLDILTEEFDFLTLTTYLSTFPNVLNSYGLFHDMSISLSVSDIIEMFLGTSGSKFQCHFSYL